MGGAAPEPGNSHAFGHSLAEWQDIYFRWFDDATLIAPDANGNAVAEHVVLLAVPDVSGAGTPAVEDLTLSTGQPFVLPLWVLQGNSYDDGRADDPLIDIKVFQTLNITVKVDDQTVITNSNVMDYYSEFYYNPAIKCPSVPTLPCPPHTTAVIWFQGIGMVHGPFSPGKHKITLEAINTDTEDLFGLVFKYNNTWNVTVKAGK